MPSGLYVATFTDVLDVTQLGLDLVSASNKIALFTNALSVNFLTDTGFASAPYTANQVASAGYTAGGQTIGSPTLVGTGGPSRITYDAADTTWAGVTLTARYAVLYADALAGKNVFYCCDFGSDFTATGGPFTIQWNASGIFQWNL
jgi:hypothetical protein